MSVTELPDSYIYGDDNDLGPLIAGDIDNIRDDQASINAEMFAPSSSDVYEAIKENLMNAGKDNFRKYFMTGKVPKRKSVDMSGLEAIDWFDKKRMKALLEMQNTSI